MLNQIIKDTENQAPKGIPKTEENWPKNIWDMVGRVKQGSNTFVLAPIEEIDTEQNPFNFNNNYLCAYIGSNQSQQIQYRVFRELP